MADRRQRWRRQLQGISRKSPLKQEPGCKHFVSLAANDPPRAAAIPDASSRAVALFPGGAISLEPATSA